MITVKIDSKLPANVVEALDPHVLKMFAERAGRWMAVVELAHVERTEVGPEEEKDSSVKMRIVDLEIAVDDNDERLREALRELYERRTHTGTLAEVGMTSVSSLLQHGAGVLA